jgi:hypothetical protein
MEKVKVNISNTILEVDKRILLEIKYFKALFDEHWKTPDDILDLNNNDITLSALLFIIDKYNGKEVKFQNEFIPTFEFLNIDYEEFIDFIDFYKINFENKINYFKLLKFTNKNPISILSIIKHLYINYTIDIKEYNDALIDASLYGH